MLRCRAAALCPNGEVAWRYHTPTYTPTHIKTNKPSHTRTYSHGTHTRCVGRLGGRGAILCTALRQLYVCVSVFELDGQHVSACMRVYGFCYRFGVTGCTVLGGWRLAAGLVDRADRTELKRHRGQLGQHFLRTVAGTAVKLLCQVIAGGFSDRNTLCANACT